uniref:Polypeptide N-acetylgalactosaminyltransferase n=1 Tax=Ascaris lumbricoides TaxID=6252 RepID=A0A9J2Q6E2_ASCLU
MRLLNKISAYLNVTFCSDKLSMDRSIPDTRHAECRSVHYDDDLPSASVVIIFTDEAWTPLLRTVHSVVNRSPLHLLHEVILLDDFSQREELKGKLDEYIKRFGGIVKLIRKKERHGLIRAKLAGAHEATGEVIVFLDSHCEANEGWLEPLLARIKEKRTAVLCPIIDYISAETMQYSGDANVNAVGGFWWSLHFRWDSIGKAERDRRKSAIEPVSCKRCNYLAYRRENMVWMCGGSIEFIPCSHVGHIFRAGHPYNMTGPGGNLDVHGTNSKRLAEVWMDDYKRLYYLHRPDLKTKDVGDLSERKALRKKLKCKSFKWYLDNVIPHKFIPDEGVVGYGALRNPNSGLCLDTLQRDEKSTITLGIFACQTGGSSAQVFSLTKSGQLRREITCASVLRSREDGPKGTIRMPSCDDNNDKWSHERGQMKHQATGFCLDVDGLKSGDDIVARTCVADKASQIWVFVKF